MTRHTLLSGWLSLTRYLPSGVKIILSVFLLQPPLVFAANNYKLIFTTDLIRHGDRTPTLQIPNAPYPWQEGLNQLTPRGMSQLYQVGQSLRVRYIHDYHLLPSHYKTATLYVRSTDYDRTLMSATSLLSGLYPLKTGPRHRDGTYALPQGFQPLPIHTVEKGADYLLLPSNVDTKKFQVLLQRYVYTQPFWNSMENKVKPNFELWTRQTGYPLNQLQNIVPLGDALYIRKLYNIPPPAGMNQTEVNEIIKLEQWVLINKFKPKPIGEFMSGAFFKQLVDNIKQATQPQNQLKSVIYLAHESNILGVMSALGLPLEQAPPYAADLRFELLKNKRDQFLIRIIYNQRLIKLPGCKSVCTLQQFLALLPR